MGELAHATMLGGALACMACTIAESRRPRILDLIAAAVMLAAMVDLASFRLVSALIWAVVLVGIGIAIGAQLRVSRLHVDRTGHADHVLPGVHRALVFIVGAWVLVASSVSTPAASVAHGHARAGGLPLVAAVIAVLGLGAWIVARLRRGDRHAAWHATEAASLTVMLAAMAAPVLVA